MSTKLQISDYANKLLVDGYTLKMDKGIIEVSVYPKGFKDKFIQKIVTVAELKEFVTDASGMVDCSILLTPHDGFPEHIPIYISFEKYMEMEFEFEANYILTNLINMREPGKLQLIDEDRMYKAALMLICVVVLYFLMLFILNKTSCTPQSPIPH